MKCAPLSLLLFSLLLLATPARAELPPDAYRAMQQQAPEVLRIVVHSVDTSICWFWLCSGRDVVVQAEVKAVERTAGATKAGDRIEIRYRHVPLDGRSGPRPIRIVREGEAIPAFLSREGDHFEPAARGASFQALVEAR